MASTQNLKILVVRDNTLPIGSNVVDFIILKSGLDTEMIKFTYTELMISASELATYCNVEYDVKKVLNPTLKSTYGAYLNYFLDNNEVIFNLPANEIPSIGKYVLSIETKILDYYTLV